MYKDDHKIPLGLIDEIETTNDSHRQEKVTTIRHQAATITPATTSMKVQGRTQLTRTPTITKDGLPTNLIITRLSPLYIFS